MVFVITRTRSLIDLDFSLLTKLFNTSVVIESTVFLVSTRASFGILSRFTTSRLILPVPFGIAIASHFFRNMVLVIARTGSLINLDLSFLTEFLYTSVVIKPTVLLISTGASFGILSRFTTSRLVLPVPFGITVISHILWNVVLVIARTGSLINLDLSLLTKLFDTSVVIKSSTIIVSTRASFGILNGFTTSRLVLPIPLGIAVISHILWNVVLVIARTGSLINLDLSFLTEFLYTSVVIKPTVLLISTGASFGILSRFTTSRLVLPVPFGIAVISHILWNVVLVIARTWSLINLDFSLLTKLFNTSIVIKSTVLLISTRASFGILNRLTTSSLILPVPFRIAVVGHVLRHMVFVVAWARSLIDLDLSLLTEFLNTSVIIKSTTFIVSARAALRILNGLATTCLVLPVPFRVTVVGHVLRHMVFVVAWTRSLIDLDFSFLTEFLNTSVIIKSSKLIISTWAALRILNGLATTSLVLPVPLRVAVVNHLSRNVMLIVAWTWCLLNLYFSLLTEFLNTSIIIKSSTLIISTRATFGILNGLTTTGLVLPIPFRITVVGHVLWYMVLVVARARSLINLDFPLLTELFHTSVIVKSSTFLISTGATFGVLKGLTTTSLIFPVPLRVAVPNHLLRNVMLIITRAWRLISLDNSTLTKLFYTCVVVESTVLLIGAWTSLRILNRFSAISLVLPIPLGVTVVDHVLWYMVLIVTRARSLINLDFPLLTELFHTGVVVESATFIVCSWATIRVLRRFSTLGLIPPIPLGVTVIGHFSGNMMLVVARSRSLLDLNLPLLTKFFNTGIIVKPTMFFIGTWATIRVLRRFSTLSLISPVPLGVTVVDHIFGNMMLIITRARSLIDLDFSLLAKLLNASVVIEPAVLFVSSWTSMGVLYRLSTLSLVPPVPLRVTVVNHILWNVVLVVTGARRLISLDDSVLTKLLHTSIVIKSTMLFIGAWTTFWVLYRFSSLGLIPPIPFWVAVISHIFGNVVFVVTWARSLLDFDIPLLAKLLNASVVIESAMFFICARSSLRVLNWLSTLTLVPPVPLGVTVVDHILGNMMLIIAWARGLIGLNDSMLTKLLDTSIIIESTMLFIGTRTAFRVLNWLSTLGLVPPVPLRVAIVNHVLRHVVLIIAWARSLLDLDLPLLTKFLNTSVVIKSAVFLPRTRSTLRILNSFFALTLIFPIPLGVAIVNHILGNMMLIVAWAGCFLN
jgi:hypothetical protein